MRKKAEGMYDVRSMKAEDFIDDAEIRETLDYADRNKDNVELIDSIIEKAKLRKGLTHREASVLLACEMPDKTAEICDLAEQIKKDFYGNRIVMFAPLYLSNYCVNGCVYCPYHIKNKHIARKKLSQDEVRREVIALQDMGHKRLAIEAGEDPQMNPIEYILECIDTIYSIRHKNGAIRRVNVNIAATTVENYRKLHEAGIGTYILFQETYDKDAYEKLHPYGPKHDYAYHTEAMDRAMEGGIDDVGLGVLFGLDKYRYEFAGLLMHAEHLEAVHGVGPHTISVPRLRHADDINADEFEAYFEPFLREGYDILHVCLSSGISGVINSANIAKAALEEKYPDRKIYVVDSLGASSGYGLIMDTLSTLRAEGRSIDELHEWIEENKLRLNHWFFSTDLSFYIKGGRISKTAGAIGKVLNICPLLNMDNLGRLIPRYKIRTKKKVIQAIVDRMAENARDGLDYSGKCYISQSGCVEDAKEVARLVEEKFPKLDGAVEINYVGTTIGSHTGPGTVALFFWGKERTE